MKTFWMTAVVALAVGLSGCQLINSAVGSDDNKLLSLVVKSHDDGDTSGTSLDLYPKFSPNQTTYVAASNWNLTYSYSVSAKSDSGSARVVVLGEDVTPVLGVNHLQVLVTAENGDRRTYDIYAETSGLDLTAAENQSLLGTVHVTNHSGHDLKDLRFGLTISGWEDNVLFADNGTILDGDTFDLTVYPGPLDIFAASSVGGDASTRDFSSTFLWDTYADDDLNGKNHQVGVAPGQTVNYEIK